MDQKQPLNQMTLDHQLSVFFCRYHKVPELRAALRQMGLEDSGVRRTLVERPLALGRAGPGGWLGTPVGVLDAGDSVKVKVH